MVRLLRALARLDTTGWNALVAANDAAGRRRPPESDAATLHQVDYMTAAGNDATAVAIAAAGPDAAEAWRRDLARVGHEQRGEATEFQSDAQTTFAGRAWGYQFVAQHMAFLIVSAHRRGRTAVRREWEPYAEIVDLEDILGR